jgi:hypothetical protein
VTDSHSAITESAFDFRSSSLLVSSRKSGTASTVPCQPVNETSSPAPLPHTIDAPTTVEAPADVDTDGGDHDRFAHYCRKEDVARAYVTGEAIEALCGKKWIPTRDPSRYPICPTCAERKAAGWTF